MSKHKSPYRKRQVRKISGVLVFLVSFSLFVLIFTGICLWMFVQMGEQGRARNSSDDSSEFVTNFTDSDVRNLLVGIFDDDKAAGFVMVRSDPAREAMWTLAFPPDTVVDNGTEEALICDLARNGGMPAVRTALGELTGIHCEKYIALNYTGISGILNHFAYGLVYELDERVLIDNKPFNPGKSTFAATQVVSLLKYEDWNGGRRQRSMVQSELLSSMINQYLLPPRGGGTTSQNDDNKTFTAIINSAWQTDILISDYNSAKPGLEHLAAKNNGEICRVLQVTGEYVGSGNLRFYPDENLRDTLKNTFSQ